MIAVVTVRPATEQVLDRHPTMDDTGIVAAVDDAVAAQRGWATVGMDTRAGYGWELAHVGLREFVDVRAYWRMNRPAGAAPGSE